VQRIVRHPEWGLDPIAAICENGDGRFALDRLGGAKNGGPEPITTTNGSGEATATVIARAVAGLDIDRAIVTGGFRSLAERTRLLRELAGRRICVDYVSGEPETLYSAAILHHLEGLPILTVQPTRINRGSLALKRSLDAAFAAGALVLLSPVLAYAAIRIKLDTPGPVLFHQPRAGRDGEQFAMLKLRTMIDGADSLRDEVRPQGIHERNGMLKLRDDPRVTRYGHRLRRWSLDELPQLWNVLRGDMSLVGPRPLPLDEAALVTDHFAERTRVRPGITGPWQTHGRSDIPFEDMVKLDYTYVVGWSMREDFRLLLRTGAAVFRRGGAY
jgi:lipopolysaccharide/colanic/teichoic acid biosynthesis glycosyltransferase